MAPHTKGRLTAATLALSAVGFAAYMGYEGFSGAAAPPLPGDVPTYGFGSTRGPDGKPLAGGENIAPPQAVALALRDVRVHEGRLKACLSGVALAQHEYDALLSLALNVGTAAVCASSIPAKARAGDYAAMCETILDFDGYCPVPKVRNAAGKHICPPGKRVRPRGLITRRRAEYTMCVGAAGAQ